MAYQHNEDGTLVLDREAAEELSKLMWEAARVIRHVGRFLRLEPLAERLELSAAALMPFPEEDPTR